MKRVSVINRRSGHSSFFEPLEDRRLFTVFVVDTVANDGPGSLRDAITQSNNSQNVADTINFNIPVPAGDPDGVATIALSSPLPEITDPVTIDATSKPVELDGSAAGAGADGLFITAGDSTVAGLSIGNFSGAGIHLKTGGGNILESDQLGTITAGNVATPNGVGLFIENSNNNGIGGDDKTSNLISTNTGAGVVISGNGASGNVLKGNVIGLDKSRTMDLGNGSHGILIENNAHDNLIGGNGNFPYNFISFNHGDGIRILSGINNTIRTNKISHNTGQGIDLNGDGPDTNDVGDPDLGANNTQNFPTVEYTGLKQGAFDYAEFHVTFAGTPNSLYVLDLYSSKTKDANNRAQGEQSLGGFEFKTDAAGHLDDKFGIGNIPANGSYITGTVTDNDGKGSTSEFGEVTQFSVPIVQINVHDVSIAEGDSGDTIVKVDFDLDQPAPLSFPYNVSLTAGTATAGVDYDTSLVSGFVKSGESTGSFELKIKGDTDVEADETFSVTMNPAYGDIFKVAHTGTVTIQNDDGTPPTPNGAPNLKDDSATTTQGTPVTIDAMANDSDPDNDALSIKSVAKPAHGTAQVVNGKVQYSPDAGFTGLESFKYTATDGQHDVQATIKVTVNPNVPLPPPSPVTIGPDDCDPGKTDLFITGTPAADVIDVKSAGAQGKVKVTLNGKAMGTFNFSGKIIAHALAGNDKVTIDSAITRSAWIDAGDGKDTVTAGSGDDLILGQAGNDQLSGKNGRDILIGGNDSDKLDGGNDDDVLIAGTTKYDNDLENFCGITKEWSRTDKTFAIRLSHLQNGGPGSFNDKIRINPQTAYSAAEPPDSLTGGSGKDAFFFNFDTSGKKKDVVTDKTGSDASVDIG